ncbi:Uncharacterized protein Adt_40184 [Abeliophyllum distichum]|uniref:Uncharacterized protein n=1 Tax=Abeliophyllum distichum TaxID=126358 RepID=A0ABD1Q780_9LAMI
MIQRRRHGKWRNRTVKQRKLEKRRSKDFFRRLVNKLKGWHRETGDAMKHKFGMADTDEDDPNLRFYLGDVGNGAALKLDVNMIMESVMASFSEELLFNEKVELDLSKLVEANKPMA